MSTDILRFVYQHPLFSQSDLTQIFQTHQEILMKKGEFLLKKGQIANEYYILQTGLVRTYLYDYHGNEITTDFTEEKQIVIDVSSIFQRIPSQEYLQCLTDCKLWKIDFEAFQELFHDIPALREWGRAWMADILFQSKKRATEMITEPTKIRYLRLLNERSQIIQQAPLKHIASYLGVTDTSLSRIRKDILST